MIKRVAEFTKTAKAITITDANNNVKQSGPMQKNPQFLVVTGDIITIDRIDVVLATTVAAKIQTSSDGGATWSDSVTLTWPDRAKELKHTVA